MYSLNTVPLILLPILVIWAWWQILKSHERALQLAKNQCHRHDVQLLDESVALERATLERTSNGRRRFLLYYRFDFSIQGDERRTGNVVLWRGQPYYTYLDMPESTLIETEKEQLTDNTH